MKTKAEILEECSSIKVTEIKNAKTYNFGNHMEFKATQDNLSVSVKEALLAMQQFSDQNTKPFVECLKFVGTRLKHSRRCSFYDNDKQCSCGTNKIEYDIKELLTKYEK